MKFSLLLAALVASAYASAIPVEERASAPKCVAACTQAYALCYNVGQYTTVLASQANAT